jgi:hypothetical protein
MPRFATLSLVALAVLCTAGDRARAADQPILGKTLIVRDPSGPDRRKITSVAKEIGSANVIVGDPTLAGSAGGALLTVAANGVTSTVQAFALPQGTSVSGREFWRESTGTGYRYKDGKGEQGPVRTVLIKKNTDGTFSIKVSITGKNGPVNVVPPNPGTDGWVTLQLGGGGDRYCVLFGADGTVTNKNGSLFKVRGPQTEGCPGPSSPSAAFLMD